MEALPIDVLIHRRRIADGSAALLHALDIARGVRWPCGHFRNEMNTQCVGEKRRCRTCRRKQWRRAIARHLRKEEHRAISAQQRTARLGTWAELQRIGAQRRGLETKEQSRALAHRPPSGLPFTELIASVADTLGLTVEDMAGASRCRGPTAARSTVNRILFERGVSLPIIGELMGRDHTTILDSIRRFNSHAARVPEAALAYNRFRDRPTNAA